RLREDHSSAHWRRRKGNARLWHVAGLCRSGRSGQRLSHTQGAGLVVHPLAGIMPARSSLRPRFRSGGRGRLATSTPHSLQQRNTMITTPSGLQYEDTVVGNGEVAQAGRPVQVHYTGWLYTNGVQGAKFDSSKDRG